LRAYEVMFILPAEADEKVVATTVDRITKVIEPTGGTVLNIDRWGRRRFAYEIDRQTEGYYVVVAFDAEPSVIAPLERALVLADEVMRAKVTIRHPQKPARPGRPGETSQGSRRPTSRPAAASEPQVPTPDPQPETSAPEPEAPLPEPQADAEGASPETSEDEPSPAPA
jgi:small subunit ribosomal protein S6